MKKISPIQCSQRDTYIWLGMWLGSGSGRWHVPSAGPATWLVATTKRETLVVTATGRSWHNIIYSLHHSAPHTAQPGSIGLTSCVPLGQAPSLCKYELCGGEGSKHREVPVLPASVCYRGSSGGSHHLSKKSKHGEIMGTRGQVGRMGHRCPVGASHRVGYTMGWRLLMGIAACHNSGCGQRDSGCLDHSWSRLRCSHTWYSGYLNGVTGLGGGLAWPWSSINLDVRAHVLGQVLPTGEGLPTRATGMGLLPWMCQNMAPQVLVADEGLSTHPTLVRSWHRLTIVVETPRGTTRAATSTVTSAALPRVVTGGGCGNNWGGNTTTPWWVDGHNPSALVCGLQQQGRCQACQRHKGYCLSVVSRWGSQEATKKW